MKKMLLLLIMSVVATAAFAFSPGDKPVQTIIPFTPGGTVDMIFREMQLYAESKGINLIGNYRPGAQGVIGIQALESLPKDGRSIGISLVDSVAAYKLATGKDVDPNNIIFLHQSVFGFVVKGDSKLNSIEDVVAKMHSDKKGVSIGFSTPIQGVIINNLFHKQAKVSEGGAILINYGKGGAALTTDVMGGNIDIGLAALAQFDPHIKTGRLKAIAVDSGQRLRLYPKVATIESIYPKIPVINRGIGVIINSTNPDELDFWKKFFADYKNTARFKERAHTEFYEIKTLSPAQITDVIEENIELLRLVK